MTTPLSRVRRLRERGIGFAGIAHERLRDFRVYDEGGCVQVWVEVATDDGSTYEALQYLTPAEAMAVAQAFEQCALAALKDGNEW